MEIETLDGLCDAHIATPPGAGPHPGVLFCVDAFGLRPTIDKWISRLANEGYAVLAPNLLYRGGRSPVIHIRPSALDQEARTKLFDRLRPLMRELTYENVARDATAYLDHLGAGPVAVVGYCMGGAFALRVAAAFPDRVIAAASFHGGNLATDAEDSPHLLASRIRAEVYVGHADHDASAPHEQQHRLAAAFQLASVPYTAELYGDAPHGFTMEDTAAYREEAAERHFVRLTELLRRTIGRSCAS